MEGILYFNKSDKRYLKKDITQIGNSLNVTLIEPTTVIDPDIILAPDTRVMEANYIWLKDFNRYYYINNFTFEYERIIAHCHVDVLMSHGKELGDEIIVMDRSDQNRASFYLNDPELRMYNYSLFETKKFTPKSGLQFKESTEQIVMVCSGSI